MSYFLPTIVKSLKYSVIETQLHSVPPFAAALGLSLVMAYMSDRTRVRLPYILFGNAMIIIGLALLLTMHGTEHFSSEYAGICLVSMGSFSAGAVIVCWYLMNLQGHRERSIGSAWVIGFGNAGGIVATFAFLSKDAPFYRTGYWILMVMVIVGTLSSLLYAALVQRERRAAAKDGNDKAQHLSL
jgi:MFS family permease